MATQSTATVNFGSKQTSASVAVTGQATFNSGTNLVEAWLNPIDTATNFEDNYWFDDLQVVVTNRVTATGFTIVVNCKTGVAHGSYSVGWVWN